MEEPPFHRIFSLRRNKSEKDLAGYGKCKHKGIEVGENMTYLGNRHKSGRAGTQGGTKRLDEIEETGGGQDELKAGRPRELCGYSEYDEKH